MIAEVCLTSKEIITYPILSQVLLFWIKFEAVLPVKGQKQQNRHESFIYDFSIE